jgi:hypothetical protein
MIDVLEENAERAETLEQCRVRAVDLLEASRPGSRAGGGREGPKGKDYGEFGGAEAVLWVEAFLVLAAAAQDAAVDRADLRRPARRHAAQLDLHLGHAGGEERLQALFRRRWA